MKYVILTLSLVLSLAASAASAACVAEYKAKRGNPLELDYGTIVVSGSTCTASAVRDEVQAQLAQRGWTLLSILSVRQSN